MSSLVSDNRSVVYGETLQDKLHGAVVSLPWWAISFVLHLGILVFAWFYTWEIPLPKDEMEIATDIREKIVLPPVLLDLPKPVTREQQIVPKERRDVRKVKLSQDRLPQIDDILKRQGTPGPNLNVLAAPGGVIRVGGVGEGEGFQPAGDLGEALSDLSDGGWWKDRCLAVWLFDESKSMKDDQQIVRQKVDELYENLGIEQAGSTQSRRIVTAVCSYGKDFHVELKDPTTDMQEIRRAIDKVPVDESGEENYLKAINGVLSEFSGYARKYSRNMVIIMVTDEGGDDDTGWQDGKSSPLEATLARMKKLNATLLVFGQEAGAFAYGSEVTYDPTVAKGVSPTAWVNRGIDTAFGEMFPFDECFRHAGRVPAGFGPYGPSRLAKETGGVYYLLRAADARSYDYEKLLGGYQPELASRPEIAARNGKNRLRRVVMEAVNGWNAIRDKEGGYRFRRAFYKGENRLTQMQTCMKVVDEWLQLTNDGIKAMKGLANVAFTDSPKHWEANRDLMWAQLHKARFQLVQYKLALDDLMNERNIPPAGQDGWVISHYRDPKLRGDMDSVMKEIEQIKAMYEVVIEKHPGTPWEAFARREMRSIRGYSISGWSDRPTTITREKR